MLTSWKSSQWTSWKSSPSSIGQAESRVRCRDKLKVESRKYIKKLPKRWWRQRWRRHINGYAHETRRQSTHVTVTNFGDAVLCFKGWSRSQLIRSVYVCQCEHSSWEGIQFKKMTLVKTTTSRDHVSKHNIFAMLFCKSLKNQHFCEGLVFCCALLKNQHQPFLAL